MTATNGDQCHVGGLYGRACRAAALGRAADIPPDVARDLFRAGYLDGLLELTPRGRALADAQREHERAQPTARGWDAERARSHTLGECPVSGGDCGMIHDDEPATYNHPDDIDLDDHVEDALHCDAGVAVEAMADEIRWLRRQRSTLAAALDQIERGNGGDPVTIAAAAMAQVGLAAGQHRRPPEPPARVHGGTRGRRQVGGAQPRRPRRHEGPPPDAAGDLMAALKASVDAARKNRGDGAVGAAHDAGASGGER